MAGLHGDDAGVGDDEIGLLHISLRYIFPQIVLLKIISQGRSLCLSLTIERR
jgi:hypothetical protein